MRVAPTGWTSLFAGVHVTEYKLVIGSTTYYAENILSNPIISRPLLEKPTIGRVCSATMTVTVRPIANTTIPKAAAISVYCRLASKDGQTTTSWLLIGKFYISSRTGSDRLVLKCRDDMIKAGQTYLDKASSSLHWPVQQLAVVQDIARIMGVALDDRTVIHQGTDYRMDSPNTEALISEVLADIGVCNGGNWVITEEGKLRLVPLASPSNTIQQALGQTHSGLTDTGLDVVISRVTLTDSEDEAITAGTDTGYEITAYSPYANQNVVNALLTALSGVIYRPYRLEVARINPLLEIGDTISAAKRDGTVVSMIYNTASITCNLSYSATLETKAEDDGEEEIPYQTAAELQQARSIRADRTYYGASLNRGSGLLVRKIRGDTEIAKAIFNADEMGFWQGEDAVFYFDAQERKWKLNGSIEVETQDGVNTTTITDMNGRMLTIEETVDGITITDPITGTTLIDGGSIVTDDLYLQRLFSRDSHGSVVTDSYVEMMENGLNFILGQSETIGIGYYSAERPQPYIIFGAGSSPTTSTLGMIKRYPNGIWIGDSADREESEITHGTGLFVNTTTRKIYKYFNGTSAELADTSNVVAVFG